MLNLYAGTFAHPVFVIGIAEAVFLVNLLLLIGPCDAALEFGRIELVLTLEFALRLCALGKC